MLNDEMKDRMVSATMKNKATHENLLNSEA